MSVAWSKRCAYYQLLGCANAMNPCLRFLIQSVLISNCVTVNTINSDTKIELPSFLIDCKLNDIIIISAPIVIEKGRYYLSKPNGDVIKLPEFPPKHKIFTDNDTIINTTKYRVFNVNNPKYFNTHDIFNDNLKKMGAMDFMLGPLGEEDHGNWVLSVFSDHNEGENEGATEFFQVITIRIIESIPIEPYFTKLNEESDLILKFAYPIKLLESCEIQRPKTSSDRYYERTRNLDSCEYIVPNITRQDQGWWTIIGVGKIIYRAKMYLEVNKKKLMYFFYKLFDNTLVMIQLTIDGALLK
ncbi:PREDICTED: uncharacterized protein LOC106110317 [Papilio polytes]|uniref:uncharacterized protein LOC106110317 n=1 Tax=Papilio polytes TaxID=76194 RepID=UPI0006766906|nr:PREDICTED: uncharacterized protein LOC106110317 [Papilio polytes]